MRECAKEDGNRKRLEDRIKAWKLYVNGDTDNTGDCQFDSAADQLRLLAGHELCTKESVRKAVTDWLRQNPDYRLSNDPDNTDTLSSWIRDTQGMEWVDYVKKMATPKEWGDEVTMKGIVEVYRVKILLWSSTVSEANYFSVHHPRDEGSEVGTLCMCHFLEVHYGSLLTQLEYARRQAEKRDTLARILQQLPRAVRLEALCDVFLHDNESANTSCLHPLDRFAIASAFDANNAEVQATLERLAVTIGLLNFCDLVIPLRRVHQYRDKLPPHVLVSIPSLGLGGGAGGGSAEGGRAELEQELSKAFALIKALKEENATLKAATTTTTATTATTTTTTTPTVHATPIVSQDAIVVDTILDEDGKKWLRAKWNLAKPVCGDMLSLVRRAVFGATYKVVQRLPAGGDQQGVTLFESPPTIGHYQVVYSRKGSELVRSDPFVVGPQVALQLISKPGSSSLVIGWSMSGPGSVATTSDYIALYKGGETNVKAYEMYRYLDPATPKVTFDLTTTSGQRFPVTIRFFSGESKYCPIATLEIDDKDTE